MFGSYLTISAHRPLGISIAFSLSKNKVKMEKGKKKTQGVLQNHLLLLGLIWIFLVRIFLFFLFFLFLLLILLRGITRQWWWQWCFHGAKLRKDVWPTPWLWPLPLLQPNSQEAFNVKNTSYSLLKHFIDFSN